MINVSSGQLSDESQYNILLCANDVTAVNAEVSGPEELCVPAFNGLLLAENAIQKHLHSKTTHLWMVYETLRKMFIISNQLNSTLI